MNPDFWPGTEIRRSTHNGFSMGLSGDWSDVIELSKARARCAAAAERQRIAGKDRSTIYGLSRKADETMRKQALTRVRAKKEREAGPGGCHPTSNAAKLRLVLADKGPQTHMQLAQATGLPYKYIGGYLANDIDKGRVLKVRALGEVIRYSLVEAQ